MVISFLFIINVEIDDDPPPPPPSSWPRHSKQSGNMHKSATSPDFDGARDDPAACATWNDVALCFSFYEERIEIMISDIE